MREKQSQVDPLAVAADVLGWLANEPDMLSRFLALSGLRADQLREAIADPGFLAGLLDFVMGHEPTLIAFSDATGTKPEDVSAAWRALSGPGLDSGEF
ncbi:DUF3572 domain-containing protein [Ciceribacter sp. L1K23]|uniref:DUF3572 domain-containing protein n=1 Tax=Ciceribacter sp. L1K23 TaxID=2820276 RepID=UPI001B824917|nr:DUF3572 domain-containing protein [Ciceribacter sp. L1K23]MBR0555997.1 DUF3572 domain-containing protein [Ciceribacter sp. L1K23]